MEVIAAIDAVIFQGLLQRVAEVIK